MIKWAKVEAIIIHQALISQVEFVKSLICNCEKNVDQGRREGVGVERGEEGGIPHHCEEGMLWGCDWWCQVNEFDFVQSRCEWLLLLLLLLWQLLLFLSPRMFEI